MWQADNRTYSGYDISRVPATDYNITREQIGLE